MATIGDTEDPGDDNLDAEVADASGDIDPQVAVDADDAPAGEELMRNASGPSQSARRRVENYLEMKRAAKVLSDLEDFDLD